MSIAFRDWAARDPDGMAISDERSGLNWRELDAWSNRAVNAVLDLQLAPEQRIAVFAENARETIQAHLAGILAGVSTVPINFHLTAGELEYILRDSGAAVLCVGPETASVGLEAARAAGVERVLGWRVDQPGIEAFDAFCDRGSDAEPPTDMAPRTFLHYTSGTTGRPKGTDTPPALFAGGETIAEHVSLVKQDPRYESPGVSMVVSPIYHTGPLGTIRSMFGGFRLAVLGRFDAEKTLACIEEHGVTNCLMVPTHFQRLLALPPEVRARYDVSSLTMVAHTGAACPVETKRAMIEWFGPVLFEAYGATEAGSTNTITSEEWLAKPGSVGMTQPQFECLILDESGARLAAGEEGEIWFRDTLGRGIIYHNDAEKTAAAHREPGVFTLGEVGYLDADGYLFITDRTSDMVVSGGVNIYPAETEQVLINHPAISDCAVIGVPNAEMGEELKALIVLNADAQRPEESELAALCREHLAGYKVPRTWEFVDSVGRNAMGKINKRKLRAPWWPTERSIG